MSKCGLIPSKMFLPMLRDCFCLITSELYVGGMPLLVWEKLHLGLCVLKVCGRSSPR